MSNAAVGEETVTWEAASVDGFGLRRKDIERCVKAAHQEAEDEINIKVLGRVVPSQVVFERRSGKYFLVIGGSKPA